MSEEESYLHRRLDCGIEMAALPLAGRRTTAYEIRVVAGLADEPDDLGGLARLVEQTLAKGTEKRSAQELSDAFDSLGAKVGSGVGRESQVYRCSCLPEYVDEALALHAEMLRAPTFPEEFCRVAVDLAQQELTALEDEPGELSRKLLAPNAYGRRLGRHELGSRESLARINREHLVAFWREHFTPAKMQVSVAGAIDAEAVGGLLERLFANSGGPRHACSNGHSAEFMPGQNHHQKALEQEHILICWPGTTITDRDYPVERLAVSALGEGMSSRLFVEVREKRGLVYWVGAWDEHPRKTGRIFLGASTTPARCDQTYGALLGEVDRLGKDLSQQELDRARVGIIAKMQTHGDITRARVAELCSDLFHYGRPVPLAEKRERLLAVTIPDVRRYLDEHPRDKLCVQTLGPTMLEDRST